MHIKRLCTNHKSEIDMTYHTLSSDIMWAPLTADSWVPLSSSAPVLQSHEQSKEKQWINPCRGVWNVGRADEPAPFPIGPGGHSRNHRERRGSPRTSSEKLGGITGAF